MPYVTEKRRNELVQTVPRVEGQSNLPTHKLIVDLHKADNKGELNYIITSIMHEYVLSWGSERNYQTLSDAKDAATGAAEEFARVVLGPYEDKKIRDNGPVSELDTIGPGQDKW